MRKSLNFRIAAALATILAPFAAQALDAPTDPYFAGKGSWEQKYDDQWAIKHVGFTADKSSAWKLIKKDAAPVIVAVIDTGLDWNHLDIDWKNIWRNPGEIADNGIDDDGNGYVDDVIGWDFFAKNNRPWDHDGHGTFVAGMIAGTWNNNAGIAGINPNAKIMVIKAINNFGHSRSSFLAEGIAYAADNGARVINLSVGGQNITPIEQAAINYAHSRGVVIVVAAGNEGVDVGNYGIAASDKVITVSSTDLKDKRTIFSNWGAGIDVAAPGIDVLSLRARRTDTMRDIPGVEYVNGANYVGGDKRYYRASGTSFSAPIVAGIASLLIGNDPGLTADEVKRIIKNSARDVDTPGVDQFSGYGLVDARAALTASKDFEISANISGVEVAQGAKGPILRVLGSTSADRFDRAQVAIGKGEEPERWKDAGDKIRQPVANNVLAEIPAAEFQGAPIWILKLTTRHKNGKVREAQFRLSLE